LHISINFAKACWLMRMTIQPAPWQRLKIKPAGVVLFETRGLIIITLVLAL
jgi:hypothetical protein